MKKFRRYEILLQQRFNDGSRVPKRLLGQTLRELETRFGAVSTETQVINGHWQHVGDTFRDDLRIYLDVEDLPAHETFFLEYKAALKARFQQLEIWLTSHDIKVL